MNGYVGHAEPHALSLWEKRAAAADTDAEALAQPAQCRPHSWDVCRTDMSITLFVAIHIGIIRVLFVASRNHVE